MPTELRSSLFSIYLSQAQRQLLDIPEDLQEFGSSMPSDSEIDFDIYLQDGYTQIFEENLEDPLNNLHTHPTQGSKLKMANSSDTAEIIRDEVIEYFPENQLKATFLLKDGSPSFQSSGHRAKSNLYHPTECLRGYHECSQFQKAVKPIKQWVQYEVLANYLCKSTNSTDNDVKGNCKLVKASNVNLQALPIFKGKINEDGYYCYYLNLANLQPNLTQPLIDSIKNWRLCSTLKFSRVSQRIYCEYLCTSISHLISHTKQIDSHMLLSKSVDINEENSVKILSEFIDIGRGKPFKNEDDSGFQPQGIIFSFIQVVNDFSFRSTINLSREFLGLPEQQINLINQILSNCKQLSFSCLPKRFVHESPLEIIAIFAWNILTSMVNMPFEQRFDRASLLQELKSTYDLTGVPKPPVLSHPIKIFITILATIEENLQNEFQAFHQKAFWHSQSFFLQGEEEEDFQLFHTNIASYKTVDLTRVQQIEGGNFQEKLREIGISQNIKQISLSEYFRLVESMRQQ